MNENGKINVWSYKSKIQNDYGEGSLTPIEEKMTKLGGLSTHATVTQSIGEESRPHNFSYRKR